MIKLVVFDFNGVLIADTQACMETDNHVLKTFGGKPVGLKVYRDTIIIPAVNFYSMHGCNKKELLKNSKKLGNVFHTFYEKRASKIRGRKYAKKVLKWLYRSDIDSVILSNHTVVGIEYQLKRLGIKEYIKKLLANTALDSTLKARNKQEKLIDYIKSNKFKKSEVAIIGDSPEEIEMGKSAGIKTIAITGGYYSASRLRKSNPDFLINNLNELIGVVKKINKLYKLLLDDMNSITIILGSASDKPIFDKCKTVLDEFGVKYNVHVASAHRTPEKIDEIVKNSESDVFIAIAGLSAALPGVIASKTTKPVIGVPVESKLDGLDALLSIVQMPPGVPVGAVGLDRGENAAILAIEILALNDDDLKLKLRVHRDKMREGVEKSNLEAKNW
jgi:5-(carboxyamino)imidazole ribonucleotide mutase